MRIFRQTGFLMIIVGLVAMSTNAGTGRSLRLTSLFSDHMVLQRDMAIPVWGKAAPATHVAVTLNGQSDSAITSADGRWRVDLPSMPAGGPYELVVASPVDTLKIRDVMVGDVWICSGQSNMEFALAEAQGGMEQVTKASNPLIRLLQVEHNPQPTPQDSLPSEGWKVSSPATVERFSAVAYYFARELLERDNVAIGLINSSYGGTPAEAWTSMNSLKAINSLAEPMNILNRFGANDQPFIIKMRKTISDWYRDFNGTDPGMPKKGRQWHDPGLDVKAWQTMDLPANWEDRGLPNFDGVVWFRKEINVPKSWKGKNLTLDLGPIDDADVTWFNGKQVGSGTVWNKPRSYTIPSKLVRIGKNIIAVRVLDTGGGGGLYGKPFEMALKAPGGDSIALAGAWQYKIGVSLDKIPAKPFTLDNPNYPTVLYNGMIAPLIPYGIRGAIWYQGEANAARPRLYRRLFPMLIRDWRDHWGQGDFPFLFVQLPNFNSAPTERWAELREAQTTALALPNTGMAVTIDVGDSTNIHPRDKATVGHRLALAAMSVAYGDPGVYGGPMFDRMEVEGDSIRIHFTNVVDGLESRPGDKLVGFAVAGIDEVFLPASARIEGNTVIVRNPSVVSPIAVRYGWESNPECTLYNSIGLPASPFRTDEWRNSTE